MNGSVFKKSIMEPTPENIQASICQNKLQRNALVVSFIQSLIDSGNGVCIALDGKWGSGKTFFVKQAQYIIEQKEVIQECGEICQLNENQLNKLIPIYYDAWKNDDSIDPLLSIIHTILQSSSHCIDNPWEKLPYKKLWPIIAECITRLPVSKIAEKITDSSAIFSYYKNREQMQSKIQEMIAAIIESQREIRGVDDSIPMKIILFIDELDRCSPDFSIRLLERVKHYINNPNITFVLSVNLEELQHTIGKFYGRDFSATSYLDRFFDVRLSLPEIDERLQNNLIRYTDKSSLRSKVVEAVMDKFSFTLRERYRYVNWCLWTRRYYDADYYRGLNLCSQIMIPYMIGLKMKSLREYEKFVRGESCEKFVSFITGEVDVFLITSYFLRPEVVWGRERDKIDINELVNKLTDLYNYVWKNDISSFDEKTISPDCDRVLIGHLQVSSTTAKSLLDIIGLLN